MAVIEGDQQTSNDAERIRATGAPAIQINTGKGCHLDAHMVGPCDSNVEARRRARWCSSRMSAISSARRLVLPFRHGENDDLMRFAKIERRRTHEIADILDKQQSVLFELNWSSPCPTICASR